MQQADFLRKCPIVAINLIVTFKNQHFRVYHAKVKKNIKIKKENLSVAIKVFDLTDSTQVEWIEKCLKAEMFISKYLKHPNIIHTLEVIKTHTRGYIVMALAQNGSIKRDLTERLGRPYTNEEAKGFFQGLCSGLQYMHSVNIAHRDLKLDNFLLTENWVPMLSDFGFAARGSRQTDIVLTQMLRKTLCGTRGYMAPELCGYNARKDGFYDAKAVDMYAMGVSLFEMLNLIKPYSKNVESNNVQSIINQKITYTNKKVENACKELINDLLKYSPEARLKVDEVLAHKWLKRFSVVNTFMDKIGL